MIQYNCGLGASCELSATTSRAISFVSRSALVRALFLLHAWRKRPLLGHHPHRFFFNNANVLAKIVLLLIFLYYFMSLCVIC